MSASDEIHFSSLAYANREQKFIEPALYQSIRNMLLLVTEIHILRLMCLIVVVNVSQHAGRISLSRASSYCHSCLPLYIRSTFSLSSFTWSGRRLAIVTCFRKNSFTMSLERPNACMLQVKVLEGKREREMISKLRQIMRSLKCYVVSDNIFYNWLHSCMTWKLIKSREGSCHQVFG